MTTYAVHLADLQGYISDLPVICLLDGILDDQPFNIGSGKFAGVGLRLNCEEERAEAICMIIRTKIKAADMRLYRSHTGKGSWKAI